ncbi:MAG: 4Fe-4S dicluster domain-containing protein [Peptostreptococcaceae bacterium]|nr:4Fe-4S dicluster domain-containing protein [Peptostreptococcaceae bacterium]
MLGIFTDVISIRRKVFAEVASIAYEDRPLSELPKSVFNILPGEEARYRQDIFKERAIVGERIRLAMGLDVRSAGVYGPLTDGVEEIDVNERIYEAPLINVIPFACEACPTKTYEITNHCRRCIGHPCQNVCPVNAISLDKKKANIDQSKCIKCGRCKDVCPYSIIIMYDRPCAVSCGVNAIGSDELGRAKIDHEKCVSCGNCMQACPFSAIADKSQIYQLVKALRSHDNIYAIIAPAFVGQFGPMAGPAQVFEAIRRLGFKQVVEVGLGADIETIHEAQEFLDQVPHKRPYMGTSCCPAWFGMVRKMFPDQLPYISESATPMIATAHYLKKKDPDSKVVFIGPCVAKKLEALDDNVKDYVDFVITFEELFGLFIAKDIEPSEIETDEVVNDASTVGRGFAAAGGVANAVSRVAKQLDPSAVIQIESANGLHECVKMIRLAKAGKKNGMLLEGMGCEGGCIGGAGTVISMAQARKALQQFSNEAKATLSTENELIKK